MLLPGLEDRILGLLILSVLHNQVIGTFSPPRNIHHSWETDELWKKKKGGIFSHSGKQYRQCV